MIHHGDLFDVLPTLEAESIDAGVTDPPYGIGFMGREWDTFKPSAMKDSDKFHQVDRGRVDHPNPNLRNRARSPALSPSQIDYDNTAAGLRRFQEWTERWAREVLRVLKPGAHIVVCGAPRSYHRMACGIEDAGFEIRDGLQWLTGQGFPKSKNLGDGWGTALKPGYEPIVLARKPFKGTTTANVEQHGVGGINVDGCRIESADPVAVMYSTGGRKFEQSHTQPERRNQQIGTHDLGRWPANLLLDEDAAAMLDEQSGELTSGSGTLNRHADKFRNAYREYKGTSETMSTYGDVGGASRFFYVAKPSREERDLGCDGLTARPRDDSRKEGNPGGDNPRNRGLQPRGNFHPTVKPLALMRWLVRLVTPRAGVVLDPFMGSGTTGMACAAEGIRFIGIEREADYIAIAERRIAAIAPLFTEQPA